MPRFSVNELYPRREIPSGSLIEAVLEDAILDESSVANLYSGQHWENQMERVINESFLTATKVRTKR